MSSNYKHLTYEERVVIRVRLKDGGSIREVSRELERAPSTVSRELRRNEQFKGTRVIYPEHAQMKANGRRRRAYRKPRLKSKRNQRYVERKLRLGWSPEAIAGRMKLLKMKQPVSHEAIYQWIYEKRCDLRNCLTRHHSRRKYRGQSKHTRVPKIKDRTPISERPASIEKREEFGHWESDLVVGRSGGAAIQVTVERKSRKVKLRKLTRRTAECSSKSLICSLRAVPTRARKSITYDNGHENAAHVKVTTTLHMQSYFCDPHHPWQRGTVENTAGIVRRRYPKKTNLSELTLQEVNLLERQLNARPRKCLGFRTPDEVFNLERVALDC